MRALTAVLAVAIVAARALATASTGCATVVAIPLARPGAILAIPIPTARPNELHTAEIPPACASTDRASG